MIVQNCIGFLNSVLVSLIFISQVSTTSILPSSFTVALLFSSLLWSAVTEGEGLGLANVLYEQMKRNYGIGVVQPKDISE